MHAFNSHMAILCTPLIGSGFVPAAYHGRGRFDNIVLGGANTCENLPKIPRWRPNGSKMC